MSISKAKIKDIVSDAKKKCKNRLYYERYFDIENLQGCGILQDENKAKFDRVSRDESRNESINLFGFDESGSSFKLSLSIFSLYPDVEKPLKESNVRFASVDFQYNSIHYNSKYSYCYEQLIDYNQNQSRDVYKIGSISLEIVSPFALSRILFNGLLKRQNLVSGEQDFVSIKMTISIHPTCDKIDYKCKFDENYITGLVQTDQVTSKKDVKKVLKLVLEDRFDQALMFQGQLDFLNDKTTGGKFFVMWGGKIKRFVKARKEAQAVEPKLFVAPTKSESREDLLIYTESGQQVHLTRLNNHKSLVYGMVHCCYDYPSYFYSCKLIRQANDNKKTEGFGQLQSLSELSSGDKIEIKAYKEKNIDIVIKEKADEKGSFKVLVNDYNGFAMIYKSNIVNELRLAQTRLWTLNLHDEEFGFKLASEKLLGGKGNSLIDLNRFISSSKSLSTTASIVGKPTQAVKVSVPRGIVVSCVAYRIWLQSEPEIMDAISELDNVRRTLAARSIHVNPYSPNYVSVSEAHQKLADQCKATRQMLISCPLPEILVEHLKDSLKSIFKEESDYSNNKPFAVRSSAVGEDSLETSAAGQMKTILGVKGFDAICNAIVECWSSQFELEAVTYKNQNGLKLNLPMAVVVQELIDCRVAGVAATCDPLTGNKDRVQLLANPGLGEGVVSGKQADTVDVNLSKLKWDEKREEKVGPLTLQNSQEFITKISGTSESLANQCCLNDEEIVSLANLLLNIRQSSDIKDREVEWGITNIDDDTIEEFKKFQIHLLQSRPLTHLAKLSAREIDHELDYGYGCNAEILSRANLGEVMPGALSPLFLSYVIPIVNSSNDGKPYEPNHTRAPFVFNSFGFYGNLANMVISHSDIITRSHRDDVDQQVQDGFRIMIGFQDATPEHKEELEKLFDQRRNPFVNYIKPSLTTILALDFGGIKLFNFAAKEQAKRELICEDLIGIEEIIGKAENRKRQSNFSFDEPKDKITSQIQDQLVKLYSRLTSKLKSLTLAWECHIRATLLNIALNIMCLKVLSSQPNSSSIDSSEMLQDFSILMRGKMRTESCDISMLLTKLIDNLSKDNQIEKLKNMNNKELYSYLDGTKDFNDFIKKNGHRCYKEFDLASITWAEDPSLIIKSLATRLKFYNNSNNKENNEDDDKKKKKLKDEELEKDSKVRDILSKIEKNRAILTNALLPRARNAVIRREHTKSFLIKTIDKYRRAFRHLGALLCLIGRLPTAELVFQVTIQELNILVNGGEENRADFSKILYKARRRKQRNNILNQITFEKPMLRFNEIVELVNSVSNEYKEQQVVTKATSENSTAGAGSESGTGTGTSVTGMTSCGGCVTGRACVVDTLDDMDQIEPDDILITYSIDISWSVYFFTLAGIVTEVGGIVSHGAVVAREYGIPTLCNAFNARSKFKTGQMVTLDASRGICYLAENNQPNGTVQ